MMSDKNSNYSSGEATASRSTKIEKVTMRSGIDSKGKGLNKQSQAGIARNGVKGRVA